MRVPFLVAAALLAVALAGCSDGSKTTNPTLPPPPPGTGTLYVLVVDPTITPIAGVKVTARAHNVEPIEGTTDATGSWIATGVAPGDYIVKASKPGFLGAQSSATVNADDASPSPTRIQLEVDPEGLPYAQELYFDGFIECGMSALAICAISQIPCEVTGQGCNVTQDQFSYTFVLDGVPDYVQGELLWDSTQAASPNLAYEMRWMDPSGDFGLSNGTRGASPLFASLNATQIDAAQLGAGRDLAIAVFTGSIDEDPTNNSCEQGFPVCFPSGNGVIGAAVSQKFTYIGHAFYGYKPPADWRYSADPEVPAPPA